MGTEGQAEGVKTKRRTISAHEISKYDYCPYQWYFERVYGRKELRRRYVERNERLQLEDHLASAFQRGEEYHRRSYIRLKGKRLLRRVAAVLLLVIAVWMVVQYGRTI